MSAPAPPGLSTTISPRDAPTALEQLRGAAPAELQEQIKSAARAMEGERKLVTALFADIVGSTEMAGRLDPEDWREIVSGVHHVIGAAVHRYGGYIAQLLGDGVLAFFGAPLAHEDDAERAARASLDLMRMVEDYASSPNTHRFAPNLQLRIGLNSGTVVVGNIGSDLKMEYLAIGDTVNLAARLQAAAMPGRILVSEATRRLLGSAFELEDRGRINVKGKGDPVQTYCVVALRSGADRARGLSGLSSPLVGRDRELRALHRLTEDLLAGRGGIVSVVAEAGIGKSRLVAEWRNSTGASSPIRWAIARCLSYDAATPYQLAAKVVRSLLGIPLDLAEGDLTLVLQEHVIPLLDDRFSEACPFLAHLVGAQLDVDQLARIRYLDGQALLNRYGAALRLLITCLAALSPLVILIDDAHWADAATVELLSKLLPLQGESPVAFAFLTRPEREAPGWQLVTQGREMPGGGVVELHLAPLTDADSQRLVDNLLNAPNLPPAIRKRILSKSEGNPFFVEEVLRMLIDRGSLVRAQGGWVMASDLPEMEIPDTVQGVIAARIDRLPEQAKRVLQIAAVIGRRFPVAILAQLADGLDEEGIRRHLVAFEAADLVRAVRDVGGNEYWFKHSLIQETVYAGLLRPARAELHRRVAAAIEALPDGDEGARTALLATHYDRAGMPAEAFRFAILAGDNARQRFAYQEAISFYDRAIALAEEAPAAMQAGQRNRAYGSRGQARQGTGDHQGALADYEMMLNGAREAGSILDEAEALTLLLPMRILLRGYSPALGAELEEALRLGKQTGDRWLEARALWSTGLAYRFSDPPRGLAYLKQAAELTRLSADSRSTELHGYALNDLSIVQFTIGRFVDSLLSSREAIRVFRQLSHQPMLTDALGTSATIEYLQGNAEEAGRLATEGCALARDMDNPWGAAYNAMVLAGQALDRGRWSEARSLALELRDNAARVRFPAFLGRAALCLARLHRELGELALASQYAEEASEKFGQMGAPLWAAMSKGLAAQAALARGDDPQVAWRHVAGLAENSPARAVDMEGVVLVSDHVLEAAVAAGMYEAGLGFCAWLMPVLESEQLSRVQGELLLGRGHLLGARNEWEAAAKDYDAAERLLERAGAQTHTWKCAAAAAVALRMCGRAEQADAALERSRASIRRLLVALA